jgi:hypothetical protein
MDISASGPLALGHLIGVKIPASQITSTLRRPEKSARHSFPSRPCGGLQVCLRFFARLLQAHKPIVGV